MRANSDNICFPWNFEQLCLDGNREEERSFLNEVVAKVYSGSDYAVFGRGIHDPRIQ